MTPPSPTQVERLGAFAANASFDQLSAAAIEALKLRVLDSLGCALGALDGEPVALVRAQVRGVRRRAALHADRRRAERARPGRALQRRAGALPRLQRLLPRARRDLPPERQPRAGARRGRVRGRRRPRAADRARGRLPGAVPALRGGAGAREGLRPHHAGRLRRRRRRREGARARRSGETANAIAIAGTSLNALRVTRTGELSHWKGLAYPATAFGATHAAFLAMRGITGPREVFEGNKGFMEAIAGPFEIDWEHEDLERSRARSSSATTPRSTRSRRSRRCSSCAPNTASTGAEVERIELDTFQVAYDIIGGGEEGDKTPGRDQGAGRPLAALPARGRAARRPGAARAVRARADRPPTTCSSCCGASRCAPTAELSRRFPAEHALPAAPASARRAHARAREARLRGLPHPPDELGDGARRSSSGSRADASRRRASSRRASRSIDAGRAPRRSIRRSTQTCSSPARTASASAARRPADDPLPMNGQPMTDGHRHDLDTLSRARVRVPARQRASAQAAHARRDRDPRPLLHADGAALPRGRARDDGRVRRHAQVRRRLVHADARARAARDHRPRHEHDVLVSTGGFIEYVLTQGPRRRRPLHRGGARARLRHRRDLHRLHQHPHRRPAAAGRARPARRAEGQAGGRHPVRRRRRHHARGARAGGHARRRLRDRSRPPLPRRRRLHDHDRVRGDHRGGHELAHRRRRRRSRASSAWRR